MANMQGKTIKNFGFHVDSLNFFPIVGIKGIYTLGLLLSYLNYTMSLSLHIRAVVRSENPGALSNVPPWLRYG